MLTRLANMSTDFNIWLDRLSNWQFVAVAASINVLSCAVAGCFVVLALGQVNLRSSVISGVLEAVAFTSVFAWRRTGGRPCNGCFGNAVHQAAGAGGKDAGR